MTRRSGFNICAFLITISSPLAAQQITPAVGPVPNQRMVTWGGKQVPERDNLLSINPLGVLLDYFNVEFEHSVSRAASIGVTGSYIGPNDLSYTSFELVGRYYPAEEGLRGFSIGPTIGYSRIKDAARCFGTCDNKATAFTLGMKLDYNWILGPPQRFAVGLGIGAKRFFTSPPNFFSNSIDGTEFIPTARVTIGYAF